MLYSFHLLLQFAFYPSSLCSILLVVSLHGQDQRKPLLTGLLLPFANRWHQQEIRVERRWSGGVYSLAPPCGVALNWLQLSMSHKLAFLLPCLPLAFFHLSPHPSLPLMFSLCLPYTFVKGPSHSQFTCTFCFLVGPWQVRPDPMG